MGMGGKGWDAKTRCRVLGSYMLECVLVLHIEQGLAPLVVVSLSLTFTILGAYNVRVQEPMNGLVVGQGNTTRGLLSPPMSFF